MFVVTPEVSAAGEQVMVRCSEGALKAMLWHALRGLPKEEGGSVPGEESVEVKGFLLGQVELTGSRRVVTIKEIVQLPFNDQDAGDAAYFNAQDRAFLEGKLRSRPSLQLVGNYHSHPNHDIKLSDQDVVYLSQYLPESYHVACIVGPREPAVGFFLKNAEGQYAPWQEPVSRIEYVRVDASEKKRDFDWRPDIEVVVDEAGNTTYQSGRRGLSKRRVAMFGAPLLALLIVLFIIIGTGNQRPIMSADYTEVALASSGQLEADVVLELDRRGDFSFFIEAEKLPPWLSVEPLNGEVTFERRRSLRITANTADIAHGGSESHTFSVVGGPKDGGAGNSVQITVTVKNDVPVEVVTESWVVPPLEVTGGKYLVRLPDEAGGSDVETTVRGYSMRDGKWYQEWQRRDPPLRFEVEADGFGSPASWERIKVEARGVTRMSNPGKILRYEYTGSSMLRKTRRGWNLAAPEQVEGKYTLVTQSLNHPAEGVVMARRGDRTETTRVGQDAGQVHRQVIEYSDDLSSIGVSMSYVGDDGVYELTYEFRVDRAGSKEDMAFDNSQGLHGRTFRRDKPDLYKDANLALFGKFGGPKYLLDIPEDDRWGRLTIVGNNTYVHESWRPFVQIGQQAPRGQMAWDYNKGGLKLYFVFPEAGYKDTLKWLLSQDVIYDFEQVQGQIDRDKRITFKRCCDYSVPKGYRVQR